MASIDQLLSVARTYAAAEAAELSTISWRAMGDTKKLSALEDGADIQVRRLERTMQWFSDHWPDDRPDVPWPAGIDRPVRAPVVRDAPQKAEAA
jgi:hypothetical protein